MKPHLKWIARFRLWDCADEEIHGGGPTPQDAYADYLYVLSLKRSFT